MNYIPKISYIELYTATPKTLTFSSQPENDPFNEEIEGDYKETVSPTGNYQRQFNYTKKTYDLTFTFQSKTVMDKFDDFLKNHALRGGAFYYYPSSDETDYEIFRLESKSVKKKRPVFAGGDFEYNFAFSMVRALDVTMQIGEGEVGVGAIGETQAEIVNNQTTWADITGLIFDTSGLYFDPLLVRAAFITYSIYRQTTGVGAVELVEAGSMIAVYKTAAATWDLTREAQGDAGVEIQILPTGQLQYKSSNIGGTPNVSAIKFKASTIGVEE